MRFVTLCLLLPLLLGLSTSAVAQVTFLDTDTRAPQGDGFPGDGYGNAVALSADGRTAVVGAPFSNGTEGAVHVFRNEGGTWVHQQRLSLTETSPGEGALGSTLGDAVAVSADGSVIVATAPFFRNEDGPTMTGGAFTFERGGDGRYTKTADLITTNVRGSDVFYFDVAMNDDGNRVVLSAVTADPATARTTPTVLTFERVGGAWTERAPALATPAEGDAFAFESAGQAIAISGNGQTVAIGNVTLYNGQGAALLFDYDGTTWQPRGEVRVPGASTFGSPSNVALDGDGDVLAVTDRSFSSFNGRVQIYTRSGNAWTQQAELVPSDGGASAAGVGEDFGLGLALRADGRALVATAPFNFDFPTTFRGRIYAFENTGGGTWVERENISLPAGEAEECLSVGLSADGATTLLGCSSVPDVPGGLFGVAVVLEDLAVDAEAEGPTPVTFGLGVAPNPVGAGQATSVRLDLDTASDVRIEVFDVLGRRVATLHDGPLSSGPQALALSTAAYPSGLYLVRATIEGEAAATRRLSVVQ